ncbi:MAG: ATP-binding protein [Acidobacteria bacterium]|nr:ATP-binding protein [Acidobacteriota bacterium]
MKKRSTSKLDPSKSSESSEPKAKKKVAEPAAKIPVEVLQLEDEGGNLLDSQNDAVANPNENADDQRLEPTTNPTGPTPNAGPAPAESSSSSIGPSSFGKYSARIKNVYIELNNYRFLHSPYSGETVKARFIGRTRVKERIKAILGRADVRSGSYLITGFRGMGKTSVIREGIEEFNKWIEESTSNKYSKVLEKNISSLEPSGDWQESHLSTCVWVLSLVGRLCRRLTKPCKLVSS